MSAANTPSTRLATRLAFVAAGFATACWAPFVPYAKANTHVEDGALGLLLLFLGAGSIIAMPLTGHLAARIGSKPMILGGGFGLVLFLPLLVIVTDFQVLGLILLLFGASLGTIDVAMNVHAVEVERNSERPLMSGFHAMFSLGGFAGAGGMTALLSWGATPFAAALFGAAFTLTALLLAWPGLLAARGREPTPFVPPKGVVLLLAALSGITFLIEGAILDWSALLIVGGGLVPASQGGLGYMLFAIAMTIGRLMGDSIVAAAGNFRVLVASGLVTICGIALLLSVAWPPLALAGFVLIGFGASNIVPVLFSLAGRQKVMPPALAIAAVTTTGYAGILAGPALIGFASHLTNLTTAFWLLAVLTILVPVFARAATRG